MSDTPTPRTDAIATHCNLSHYDLAAAARQLLALARQLERELADVKERLTDTRHRNGKNIVRAEKAEAALAEARRDAERYRFLKKDFGVFGLNIDGNHVWAYRRNASLRGTTLDAAIDAAMKDGK